MKDEEDAVNLAADHATCPGEFVALVPQRPDDPDLRTAALQALWELHYAALARWCATLVGGDRDDAQDVASEAFARLLSRWLDVRDPRGFLYVTATNLARDRWRREKRQRQLESRLVITTLTAATDTDPGLRDLVERLPHRMRAPVLLHYYADMSVADVAKVLHRPEGTIKRTLYNARGKLLASLQDAVAC